MSKNIVAVMYHGADLDGILSGVIAHRYLHPNNDEVHLFPMDYGDKIPALFEANKNIYRDIYMIDFTNKDVLADELINRKITLIDHHKTAIEDVREKKYPIKTYLIEGVAACRLTFQFFTNINYPLLEREQYAYRELDFEPLFVTLAGEYDIWDHRSPFAMPLNFGIAEDMTFANVAEVYNLTQYCPAAHFDRDGEKVNADKTLTTLVEKGSAVLNFIKGTSDRLNGGVPIKIGGYEGVAFNTHIRSSNISDVIKDNKVIMVWGIKDDPSTVTVSLYGDPEKNLHLIAKKFGGGGHPGACGFQMEVNKFISYLNLQGFAVEDKFAV